MGREVAVAELKPGLAAQRRQRGHEAPGLVTPAPAALRIVERHLPQVVVRLADQTGADAPTIASAYAAVRDSYDLILIDAFHVERLAIDTEAAHHALAHSRAHRET